MNEVHSSNLSTTQRDTDRPLRFEIAILRGTRRLETPWLTASMRGITFLGSGTCWTLFSLVLIFAAMKIVGMGVGIGLSALAGALTAKLIKYSVRRPRPTTDPACPPALSELPDPWAFPSGHTLAAFTVCGGLFLVGSPWAFLAVVFAFLVGCSRIYLGVHYPTDVLAGALFGSLLSWALHPAMTIFLA